MRLYGEFPKETEIGEVETLGAKGPFAASTCDPETGARSRKAAIPRHFAHEPGKSPFGGTGWWTRQDSNLQTDRYARTAFGVKPRAQAARSARPSRATATSASPLRCFALGLALGLVAAGSGQSCGQPYLRVVVITRGGNDVGDEMIDCWFQRLALLAGRNVGPANDAWPKHAC
jgi:hypothetical protein